MSRFSGRAYSFLQEWQCTTWTMGYRILENTSNRCLKSDCMKCKGSICIWDLKSTQNNPFSKSNKISFLLVPSGFSLLMMVRGERLGSKAIYYLWRMEWINLDTFPSSCLYEWSKDFSTLNLYDYQGVVSVFLPFENALCHFFFLSEEKLPSSLPFTISPRWFENSPWSFC